MNDNPRAPRSQKPHYVRLPAMLLFMAFVTVAGYTAGSIYLIMKKDNEVEKFRRIELDLQNQIKERDLNIQQYRQRIDLLERRVKIFDAVKELSHAGVTPDMQRKIAAAVDDTSRKFGFDPCLILALMATESSLRPWAKSGKGASGLMQMMPQTGRAVADWIKNDPKLLGLREGEELPELTLSDIESNIQMGILYLTHLLVRYNNLKEAIYAYNLGPNLYDKRKREGGQLPVRYYQKVLDQYNRLAGKPSMKPVIDTSLISLNQ